MDIRKNPNPRAALKCNELAIGGTYLVNGPVAQSQLVVGVKSMLADGPMLVLFLPTTDQIVPSSYFGPGVTFREVRAHITVEFP